MDVSDTSFSGFYARFETVSKESGALLMGPDNIVGNDFEVFFKTEGSKVVAWLRNRFGAEVGYFGADASRKLQLMNAREMVIRAVLSFVAYSDMPEPGMYWGEMAIFGYNPAYEKELGAFVDRCAQKIGEGIRPDIDLRAQSVSKLLEENDWMPSNTIPLPKMEKGNAILKSHQSMSEKMIEQGRSRNIGCYIVSWAFIILVVIGILFGLHALGLF